MPNIPFGAVVVFGCSNNRIAESARFTPELPTTRIPCMPFLLKVLPATSAWEACWTVSPLRWFPLSVLPMMRAVEARSTCIPSPPLFRITFGCGTLSPVDSTPMCADELPSTKIPFCPLCSMVLLMMRAKLFCDTSRPVFAAFLDGVRVDDRRRSSVDRDAEGSANNGEAFDGDLPAKDLDRRLTWI